MSRRTRPERPGFLHDRRGAVTLDWTTLVAALVIGGVAAVVLVGDDAMRIAGKMMAETEDGAGAAGAADRVGLTASADRSGPAERERAPSTLFRPEAPDLPVVVLDETGTPVVARRSDTGGRGAFDPALAEPGRPDDPRMPVLAVPVLAGGSGSPEIGGLDTGCLRDASRIAEERRAAGWIGAVARDRPDCPEP